MPERICFVGLDVHARKTAAAAVQLGSGEVFKAQIPGPPVEAIEWLKTLAGPVRVVYEAGPTGFGLVRAARAAGIEMMVCERGAIPRQPGDRVKTDTRDALKLARLLAAGQLRAVVVPEPELEALRDLVRCREDLRGDLMACRHRITKLLLRRGLIYPGPGVVGLDVHATKIVAAVLDAVTGQLQTFSMSGEIVQAAGFCAELPRPVRVAQGPGTVSVINGAVCNAQETSGCNQIRTRAIVGDYPSAVTIDPATATAYVADGEGVSVAPLLPDR